MHVKRLDLHYIQQHTFCAAFFKLSWRVCTALGVCRGGGKGSDATPKIVLLPGAKGCKCLTCCCTRSHGCGESYRGFRMTPQTSAAVKMAIVTHIRFCDRNLEVGCNCFFRCSRCLGTLAEASTWLSAPLGAGTEHVRHLQPMSLQASTQSLGSHHCFCPAPPRKSRGAEAFRQGISSPQFENLCLCVTQELWVSQALGWILVFCATHLVVLSWS